MADREKVVRAVETCFDSWIDKHRYKGLDLNEVVRMKRDALELLRAQEPVKPVNYLPYGYLCGCCLQPLEGIYDYHPKYCPNCGREVKWNDSN